jgi:hypothetical protein
LLLWLDHTLAPQQVRVWHLHSLLWFAGTVVTFGMAARKLLPRVPAMIAVGLLACDAAFVSPLGWLANRCVLIAALFGFAAIFVHLEWRRPEPDTPRWLRRFGAPLECVLVLLCLGGGEYGLGVFALVFGWELMVGCREAEAWRARARVAARALAPAMVPVLVYLAVHKLLGYGTSGADIYADPINHPLGWLRWAKLRVPMLAHAAIWGVPASSVVVFRHPGAEWWFELFPSYDPVEIYNSHMWFSLFGIGLLTVLLLLGRAGLHARERWVVRAMLLGGFLGLLPISVAPSHERLLVINLLAAGAIVGLLVVACVRLLAGRAPASASWPARLRGAGMVPLLGVLLWLNTVEDVKWNNLYLVHLDGMQASDLGAYTEGDLLEQELGGRDVIVLNAMSQTVAMYGPFVLHANGAPVPASWRSLALGGNHPMWAFRKDKHTLELVGIEGGAWLRTAGELFFRRLEQHLPAGSTFDYPGMQVEVLADDDGDPTRVRFRFPHSLDDPRYLFLVSTKRGLMRWDVPPVWGSNVVPRPRQPYVVTRDVLFELSGRGPK